MVRFGRSLSVVLIVIATIAASGCNTVKGVGKDIQKTGEKIEDAAEK